MSISCAPNPVFVDFRFGVGRRGQGGNIKTGVWVQEIDENAGYVTLIGMPFGKHKTRLWVQEIDENRVCGNLRVGGVPFIIL